MSELSELLSASNTQGLSARSIARAAQDLGYTLNHDTAARYLRGDHGRPDEPTLVALSSVMNVPLSKLRRAASLPADVTEPYRPPAEASRLSRRQRRAVDEIIRAMLEAPAESALSEPKASQRVSGRGSVVAMDPRRGTKAPAKAPAKQAARTAGKTAAEPVAKQARKAANVKATTAAARRGAMERT